MTLLQVSWLEHYLLGAKLESLKMKRGNIVNR